MEFRSVEETVGLDKRSAAESKSVKEYIFTIQRLVRIHSMAPSSRKRQARGIGDIMELG
jgi:hypothetical protein